VVDRWFCRTSCCRSRQAFVALVKGALKLLEMGFDFVEPTGEVEQPRLKETELDPGAQQFVG